MSKQVKKEADKKVESVSVEEYNKLLEQAQQLQAALKSANAKLAAIANVVSC